ncbi:dihydrodipicolinate synthase family protein [Flintibacter muris]|uniref:dihydrodipicolinate synthase family protein n=1 Tax=Flintibacter muris TaxID=2941327 RepID=UPI00203DA198|nr:dihydrodipicolinate synthase family protein [Flintibacter muris]
MKTKEQLGGIYSASITAYDQSGQVDGAALQRVMERNLKEGAAGFFVGGSSGECFLLTEGERVEVFEAASSFAGRTNLIAHVGAISTDEAVRYAKAAMGMGFDSTAATAPFYYGFSPKEICRYYYDIAEASGAPVLIYNFPGNTHKEFNTADPAYVELLRSGAILGVKQTNYNLYQMERILNLNPDLIAFNGYDETMVAGQALGCVGSIGSTFNMMLPHYKKIFDLFDRGEREEALALQHKANNCMEAMCSVGLIAAIKYELERQGYPVGQPRKPFAPLTQEQKDYVDGVLDKNLVEA